MTEPVGDWYVSDGQDFSRAQVVGEPEPATFTNLAGRPEDVTSAALDAAIAREPRSAQLYQVRLLVDGTAFVVIVPGNPDVTADEWVRADEVWRCGSWDQRSPTMVYVPDGLKPAN